MKFSNLKNLLLVAFLSTLVFQLVIFQEKNLGMYHNNKIKPPTAPVQSGSIDGLLFWEKDDKFIKLVNKYQTIEKMGAFKTTLPHPLPGEEENVAIAADKLAGTVLQPGEIFSMNYSLGPYTKEHGYKDGPTYSGTQIVSTTGGGVCKIATTLYNVAVLGDLQIIERHAHGMLVPYVPPGQDATVSYGIYDFKFKNTTKGPLLIWADTKSNTLYMGFYGNTKAPKVVWQHKIINRQKTYTIFRYNKNLLQGTEKVVTPGADGVTVKSWLTVEYADGKKMDKEIGVDYYKPMPRVIERGLK